ncbi:MAG: hypothetical protein BGP06_12230 [Rhizobiales bacterium 65-9]|nr:hypothetical protein [Hyphomicrobiales bacterium]OJY37173.1 MAG: hypothetical protein BGP06_12230 [Rhizobiales bacterium 65-9]
MSAVNVIRKSDSVHLICDGQVYTRTGAPAFQMTKILEFPNLNAAIAMRGNILLLSTVLLVVMGAGASFDEVRRKLPDALRKAFEEAKGECEKHSDAPVEIELAMGGFRNDGSSDSFLIHSHQVHSAGSPWKVIDTPIATAPGTPEIIQEFQSKSPDAMNPEAFDPVRHGLILLEAQRARESRIGAFAQLTSVHRDRIETRILRRWN